MTPGPTSSAMRRQIRQLANDIGPVISACEEQLSPVQALVEGRSPSDVVLTGVGDSYAASLAAEMAFEVLADRRCRAVAAQPFVDYGGTTGRAGRGDRALVVGVSASGRTDRVLEALAKARGGGALTLGVTTVRGSPISDISDHTVTAELHGLEPSPGVRTFQASLIALFCLAIAVAEPRAREAARARLRASSSVVAATADRAEEVSDAVAAHLVDAPWIPVVGTGPSYGTARFGAAKLMESAGVPAVGQDLEEWWHVERFVPPAHQPVVVIAPPGRSAPRATALGAAARGLGRRVIVVGPTGSPLAVEGTLPEELSALAYHIPITAVAAALSEHLDRVPFRAGQPGFSAATR